MWRIQETGSLSSGVVAYPNLEASHQSSQPAVGQASVQQTADASRDATQPFLPSLSLSSPRSTSTAQGVGMRESYPSMYSQPQHRHWYYDPTRHPQFSSHLQPILFPSPMSGLHFPSVPLVTDVMPDPLSASLRALQSQFTAFQESLGSVESNVKDALSQLHALRTAQNKTDNCIAELEDVIGVGTGSRGRGGRGRGGGPGTHTEPPLEGADAGTIPEKTLRQSLASIQSAFEVLLARENRASSSRECLFSLCFCANQPTRSVSDPSRSNFATASSTIRESYRTGILPDIVTFPITLRSISTAFDITINTIYFCDLVHITF